MVVEEGEEEAAWVVRVRQYIDHVAAIVDDGLEFESGRLIPSNDMRTFLMRE